MRRWRPRFENGGYAGASRCSFRRRIAALDWRRKRASVAFADKTESTVFVPRYQVVVAIEECSREDRVADRTVPKLPSNSMNSTNTPTRRISLAQEIRREKLRIASRSPRIVDILATMRFIQPWKAAFAVQTTIRKGAVILIDCLPEGGVTIFSELTTSIIARITARKARDRCPTLFFTKRSINCGERRIARVISAELPAVIDSDDSLGRGVFSDRDRKKMERSERPHDIFCRRMESAQYRSIA